MGGLLVSPLCNSARTRNGDIGNALGAAPAM